ncbi:MAG: B12-binding domain-containing radical SAM protein [Candidatus Thiodiazotropha sp. (ex Lucinoma annulata)]|nr:B12-binding domain-containing radical SAM protein [Candidatus Thiodiazotropha sp. (ex Lucinoma annulata)]
MKLKYLLVVPKIVSSVGHWYQPPLGLAYISAALKEAGFDLYGVNLNNEEVSVHAALEAYITEYAIDVVLTGGVTGQYGTIRDIIENAKLIKPEVITIVGGGIITSTPHEAMAALEYVDYGVIGEGEVIACELCRALEEETDIAEVPSIIYQPASAKNYPCLEIQGQPTPHAYRRTEGVSSEVDIAKLPFPDYEGVGFDRLLHAVPDSLGMSEENTVPIVTSRGCPFKCTFCYQPDGQKYRKRPLDSVFEEIDHVVERYGVKYLCIIDELFGTKKEYVKEFCRRIKPYGIPWIANFRIPQITAEMVAMLQDANCHTVSLGIESMDDTVLESMKKKITREQIKRGLRLIYEAGMGIQGILIFGDPAETVESATNTFNWWKANIHYDLQLSAVITYPGTPIYDYALQEGIITDPVKYIREGCPLVRLSKMTDEEYAWMFGQIISLPRSMHDMPRNVQIMDIDYEHATLKVAGRCMHCDMPNEWKGVRTFFLESMACAKCGRRHISPIPDEFIERIRANLEQLAGHYGKVAFWGINSYFYAFSEKLSPKPEKYIYVDKSESRIGVHVAGQTICSPESIADLGIQCVVVSVPTYYAGLKTSIEKEFPKVERVINILDLLQIDFSNEDRNISPCDTSLFVQPDLETCMKSRG